MSHPAHDQLVTQALTAAQERLRAQGHTSIQVFREHHRAATHRVDAMVEVVGMGVGQRIFVEADMGTEANSVLQYKIGLYADAEEPVIWATPSKRRFTQVAAQWTCTPQLIGYYDGAFYSPDGSLIESLPLV